MTKSTTLNIWHTTNMHIKHSSPIFSIQPQILYMLNIFHLHYTSHRANFSFHAHFPLWNKNPSTPLFCVLFCRIYSIFSLLLLILRRPKNSLHHQFCPSIHRCNGVSDPPALWKSTESYNYKYPFHVISFHFIQPQKLWKWLKKSGRPLCERKVTYIFYFFCIAYGIVMLLNSIMLSKSANMNGMK